MAFISRKVTIRQLLRNWAVVYVGNFVGSIATVGIIFLCSRYRFGQGLIWLNASTSPEQMCQAFLDMVALGILCNALVCIAVWLCYSARSTTDKIWRSFRRLRLSWQPGLNTVFANMYFIPAGLAVKYWGPQGFWTLVGKNPIRLSYLNGIISFCQPDSGDVGKHHRGTVMVGLVYWFVYRRKFPRA